jgi:hypothetical protein
LRRIDWLGGLIGRHICLDWEPLQRF